LLLNGSFEDGNFGPWTVSDPTFLSVVQSGDGYVPQDGSYFVEFGPVGSDSSISQTVSDTPGQHYLISGWVAGNGSGPSDFDFNWNGVLLFIVSPVPDQDYVNYTALVGLSFLGVRALIAILGERLF
jgi:hypothetical protein